MSSVESLHTNKSELQSDNMVVNRDDEELIGNTRLGFGDEVTKATDSFSMPKYKPQVCGMARGLAIVLFVSTVFASAVTIALVVHVTIYPIDQVEGPGAVTSESTECSKIGLKVLHDHGNAVDAAIATLFCLGVTENHHSGLGGGFFMLIHDHRKNTSTTIDARESAPAGASPSDFLNQQDEYDHTGLAVAVPGQVKGLAYAHKKYGKLPWKRLISPSIHLARQGYNISRSAVHSLKKGVDLKLIETSNIGQIYMKSGQIVGPGAFIKNPALADTLALIANMSADVMYSGKTAKDIVDAVALHGGNLTLQDLQNYKVIERPAISTTFSTPNDNYTIVTMPLPGGGPTLINILNIIGGFDWIPSLVDSPKRYYQLLETFRYAYAARTKLGDPDFDVSHSIRAVNHSMTSFDEANKIRAMISSRNHTLDESMYGSSVQPSDHGTTHISVVDANEVFVSATATINNVLGAKIMTSSGIILNNEMKDFSASELDANGNPINPENAVAGGKRPLSSMTPTMVFDHKQACGPRFAIGGINGSYITQGVAETILNHIVLGMNLTQAIKHPRIVNTLSNITYYDRDLNSSLVGALRNFGYDMQEATGKLSYILALSKINNTITAATDPALSGLPATSASTTFNVSVHLLLLCVFIKLFR